jgi:hypothetical protein
MQMGAKWTGGVVQAVECLPEFKSQSHQKLTPKKQKSKDNWQSNKPSPEM